MFLLKLCVESSIPFRNKYGDSVLPGVENCWLVGP